MSEITSEESPCTGDNNTKDPPKQTSDENINLHKKTHRRSKSFGGRSTSRKPEVISDSSAKSSGIRIVWRGSSTADLDNLNKILGIGRRSSSTSTIPVSPKKSSETFPEIPDPLSIQKHVPDEHQKHNEMEGKTLNLEGNERRKGQDIDYKEIDMPSVKLLKTLFEKKINESNVVKKFISTTSTSPNRISVKTASVKNIHDNQETTAKLANTENEEHKQDSLTDKTHSLLKTTVPNEIESTVVAATEEEIKHNFDIDTQHIPKMTVLKQIFENLQSTSTSVQSFGNVRINTRTNIMSDESPLYSKEGKRSERSYDNDNKTSVKLQQTDLLLKVQSAKPPNSDIEKKNELEEEDDSVFIDNDMKIDNILPNSEKHQFLQEDVINTNENIQSTEKANYTRQSSVKDIRRIYENRTVFSAPTTPTISKKRIDDPDFIYDSFNSSSMENIRHRLFPSRSVEDVMKRDDFYENDNKPETGYSESIQTSSSSKEHSLIIRRSSVQMIKEKFETSQKQKHQNLIIHEPITTSKSKNGAEKDIKSKVGDNKNVNDNYIVNKPNTNDSDLSTTRKNNRTELPKEATDNMHQRKSNTLLSDSKIQSTHAGESDGLKPTVNIWKLSDTGNFQEPAKDTADKLQESYLSEEFDKAKVNSHMSMHSTLSERTISSSTSVTSVFLNNSNSIATSSLKATMNESQNLTSKEKISPDNQNLKNVNGISNQPISKQEKTFTTHSELPTLKTSTEFVRSKYRSSCHQIRNLHSDELKYFGVSINGSTSTKSLKKFRSRSFDEGGGKQD